MEKSKIKAVTNKKLKTFAVLFIALVCLTYLSSAFAQDSLNINDWGKGEKIFMALVVGIEFVVSISIANNSNM